MSGAAPSQAALLALVEATRWQRLQDHCAAVLGIPLRTVSPSRELLVAPSWPPGFDVERAISALRIGEELDELLPNSHPPREVCSLSTPVGVTFAAVPIQAPGAAPLAYIIVGPVVVGPREEEAAFRERAGRLGLDAQALWSLLLSFRLHTFASIRGVLQLLEDVGYVLVQGAEPAGPPPARAGDAGEVLQALLETALLATQADGGSVMVWDGAGETLRIRTAHGLPAEVLARTALRRGEGLAGRAVEQREILLVDERTTDPQLRAAMHRPEVVSSLLAPLNADPARAPLGVLSLWTTHRARAFTPAHAQHLRHLLELAGGSLAGLSLPRPA
jgi:hypothetical protein